MKLVLLRSVEGLGGVVELATGYGEKMLRFAVLCRDYCLQHAASANKRNI